MLVKYDDNNSDINFLGRIWINHDHDKKVKKDGGDDGPQTPPYGYPPDEDF